jgi:glycosyltransferase involved in cell wall biosynthesis
MSVRLSLSVIIPTYNAEGTLKQCLQAIRRSSYPPSEIIVIDDTSNDNTCAIATAEGARVIRQPANRGQGAARNVGSAAASEDVLVFVDADVVVSDDTLEIIANHFLQHPEVAAITGRLSKIHPHDDFFSQYKNLYMNVIFGRVGQEVDFIFGSIFAVRRSDYLPMQEQRVLAEDTELGFQLCRAGKKIHLLQNLEVIHLKRYTFKSLIINDFLVPFYFAKLFVRHRRQQATLKQQRFSHTSHNQILSVMLAPLSLACIVLAPRHLLRAIALVSALTAIVALNRDLFRAYFGRNTSFGVLSIPFSYIDMIVMASGIACGMFSEVLFGTQAIDKARTINATSR